MACDFFFFILVREHLKDLTKQYDKSENDLKALQSVGQVCCFLPYIIEKQLFVYIDLFHNYLLLL